MYVEEFATSATSFYEPLRSWLSQVTPVKRHWLSGFHAAKWFLISSKMDRSLQPRWYLSNSSLKISENPRRIHATSSSSCGSRKLSSPSCVCSAAEAGGSWRQDSRQIGKSTPTEHVSISACPDSIEASAGLIHQSFHHGCFLQSICLQGNTRVQWSSHESFFNKSWNSKVYGAPTFTVWHRLGLHPDYELGCVRVRLNFVHFPKFQQPYIAENPPKMFKQPTVPTN